MTTLMTVRTFGNTEAVGVANVLARAFYNDPMIVHLWPDPATRIDAANRGFHLYLRKIYLSHRHCYTVDELLGASLWMPPGTYPLSSWQLMQVVPGLARVFGLVRTPGALRDIARMESLHPQTPPHWYLGFVGVEPSRQRQGVGTSLMQPVLDICDHQRLPAYLETCNELNLPLYLRLGFETMKEIDIRRWPHVWGMWRRPTAEPRRARSITDGS
jgi:GNAT superfamily N-acetyltransferase